MCHRTCPVFVYTGAFPVLSESKGNPKNFMLVLLSQLGRHGYALVFGILLAEALGFPFPAAIALVAAGAGIASHTLSGIWVLAAALIALTIGDTWQFWLGLYTGWALLAFLCRVSMNPETCMLRSAESFYKRGKTTLLFSKFIPGINTMAAPLAGSMKMPFGQFLRLDFAGSLLYALTYLLVGYIFRDFLAAILNGFQTAGRAMEVLLVAAVIAYIGYRVMKFMEYRSYDIVPRVQVEELAARIAAGESDKIQIVDVRSHGYYDAGAERIYGSIRIEPNNLDEEIKNLPKDKDIYLYCT